MISTSVHISFWKLYKERGFKTNVSYATKYPMFDIVLE